LSAALNKASTAMDSHFRNRNFRKRNFRSRTLEAEFRHVVRQQKARSVARSAQICLRRLAQEIVHYLTGQQSLSIQQQTTLDGRQRWVVYDPASNTCQTFSTQQSVREWLEIRHLK